MSRAALLKLLIAQTVLLIVVAWAGVYFARDEYQLATAGSAPTDDDEGLTARSAAGTDAAGVPTVRLAAAAQRNVGLEVARAAEGTLAGGMPVSATVLDVAPLIELQGRLRAARSELASLEAQARASAAERERVQALYDDDRNASARALEAARAAAAADAARVQGGRAALAALQEGARAQWGEALARELAADTPGNRVALLGRSRAALLRVLLPADAQLPAHAELLLAAGVAGKEPRIARPLGAAGGMQGGEAAGGRSLLYAVEASGLQAGQRVGAQLRDPAQQAVAGAWVPASALVWHAGQPWIYVQGGAAAAGRDDDDDAPAAAASAASAPAPAPAAASETFTRRAVPLARRVGDRWFLPGLDDDTPVVVRGAQVLLSEELKFQIRNENDD